MADVEIATVLPRELRLGVPPKMPQARSYLFRQQSTLATTAPTGTITINIPRLQRSYLRKDSYLRFRLNGLFTPVDNDNSSDTLCLDTAGAYGLFDRIEVFDYLGSTVLESISGIPQLSALLLDLGLREYIDKNNGTALAGLDFDYAYNGVPAFTPGTAANAVTASATGYLQNGGNVYPPSSGIALCTTPVGTTTSTLFSREFAISLPSFLGLLSDKMVPLHNGFTIVLTLANSSSPFFVSQSGFDGKVVLSAADGGNPTLTRPAAGDIKYTEPTVTWELADIYMNCQILELGPVAESMIMSSSQGSPLVVHTKSFRNYVGTITGSSWSSGSLTRTGQSEFVLNMNLNVASLTNILWIMRASSQLESLLYASIGNRTRNFLQRWQFQYGSTCLPQSNGIQTMASYVPSSVQNVTPGTTVSLADKYLMMGMGGTEGYQELMKARPVYLPANRIPEPCFNWDMKWNYNLDAATNPTFDGVFNLNGYLPTSKNAINLGRFAAGLNLQLANGKEGQIISGLNTNGMNTSIRGTFHPSYTDYMDTVRVDAWAEYDAFVNISPGIATTVSF